MHRAYGYLAVFLFWLPLPTPAASNIVFTTFNIAWYGLGGSLDGSPKIETRDKELSLFLEKSIPKSDVFAFQEIVDVERLQNNVLGKNWSCVSYQHENEKHQHVVLCHRMGLQFLREKSDDNDLIDDVALGGKVRPALHLILADAKGQAMTRIIAVHLKAYPAEAKTRYKQIQSIAEYLKALPKELPIVVLGDHNTFSAKQTKEPTDDDVMISKIYKDMAIDVYQIKNGFVNTYNKGKSKGHFDRIWVSRCTKQIDTAWVYSACNEQSENDEWADIKTYNKQISDHCPVSVEINFDSCKAVSTY